jgi:hypothetical protein
MGVNYNYVWTCEFFTGSYVILKKHGVTQVHMSALQCCDNILKSLLFQEFFKAKT